MTDQFLHGVQVVDADDGSRSIAVASSSVICIIGTAPRADVIAFPVNTPVLVTSATTAAKLLLNVGTDDGTLPSAIDSIFDQAQAAVVVIRVEAGLDDAATLANVIGGVNAVTGAYEGVHAALAAQSVLGVKPRILIAPGFTHVIGSAGSANAVVAELIGIAETLRAVILQDGPSTTDADAIALAGAGGSKRVYLVDPQLVKLDATGNPVNTWGSACAAGVIAYVDNAKGWWFSPSNNIINGVTGLARPIDFAMGVATSRANLLNAANVATVIRLNGFRLWGNRTLSADPKWAFLPVVRTADIIADSLQDAHLWAVDQGVTKNYVEEVQEGVNAFLRGLKTKGAILGGSCWLDKDLNSPADIAAGKVSWDFDFTPVYPAEDLTFRSHLVNNYITGIF